MKEQKTINMKGVCLHMGEGTDTPNLSNSALTPGYKQKLDDAIQQVFEELNNMTQEEFNAAIERAKNDHRYVALKNLLRLGCL